MGPFCFFFLFFLFLFCVEESLLEVGVGGVVGLSVWEGDKDLGTLHTGGGSVVVINTYHWGNVFTGSSIQRRFYTALISILYTTRTKGWLCAGRYRQCKNAHEYSKYSTAPVHPVHPVGAIRACACLRALVMRGLINFTLAGLYNTIRVSMAGYKK